MYCVPVGACVSSVIPWFFVVFTTDICLVCVYEGGYLFDQLRYTGILWRVLLVKFLCAILLRMGCGRSCLCCVSCLLVCVFCLLVLFASCMSVGSCIAVKESSVSCVNLSQSTFL